ncbi:RNA polymerase, sigma-24 subunit, ECF subfamily [Fibrisoma limi BUZ 3]|uniref:RNA polymerase, sigma-24 subunit, ECF subfamily n=1 Tax=Fibrisoma limi BUZ 3 TaxID=1185876 RepID=I2GKI1_9BACT|nr:sigma-70 family RNA polymerase sigma factor [Fibrisoma limi]CCH54406.1 RNA polymerase, sigma-24 subunit, ECF subfamily [Fibrisoma limi BUZ 3]
MVRRLPSDEAQQLWQEYRAGDIYALAKLMQSYYADLFHWGVRLHADREFVKDCIQEVFVNLWKIQDSISSVENVRSYLLVVLKTRILRELSKTQGAHQADLSDDYSFSVEFAADIRLIEEEHEVYQIRRLERVLNHLPQRQKELIYLRFYQNLSFEQIAEIMHLGRQSVYNLLQKSLNSLRKNWTISTVGVLVHLLQSLVS